jgi:hypothetical protein
MAVEATGDPFQDRIERTIDDSTTENELAQLPSLAIAQGPLMKRADIFKKKQRSGYPSCHSLDMIHRLWHSRSVLL